MAKRDLSRHFTPIMAIGVVLATVLAGLPLFVGDYYNSVGADCWIWGPDPVTAFRIIISASITPLVTSMVLVVLLYGRVLIHAGRVSEVGPWNGCSCCRISHIDNFLESYHETVSLEWVEQEGFTLWLGDLREHAWLSEAPIRHPSVACAQGLRNFGGASQALSKAVRRIRYVPLVYILCWGPSVAEIFITRSLGWKQTPPWFFALNVTCFGLQGALNGLLYGATPSVRRAWREWFQGITGGQSNARSGGGGFLTRSSSRGAEMGTRLKMSSQSASEEASARGAARQENPILSASSELVLDAP
jgi:hypothetical protein